MKTRRLFSICERLVRRANKIMAPIFFVYICDVFLCQALSHPLNHVVKWIEVTALINNNNNNKLLVCANDVNLLGDNIDIIKKNTQTSIDASKKVGLEVSTAKNKYVLLSRHQNAGQNHTSDIWDTITNQKAQWIGDGHGAEGRTRPTPHNTYIHTYIHTHTHKPDSRGN
jgi:hypothetical protein